MTVSLIPVPKFRAFDATGVPLAGGLVYTYAAGTTTPLATYQSSDESPGNQNTNPVVLDAEGYADIWLTDGLLYKITLADADDVPLWTVDDVSNNASSSTGANGGFGEAESIASGTLVDLGTIASHFALITGTTTINSFGSSATLSAPIYLVKFNGALTLTASASLFLPGSANITTAQNDRAWLEYLGSGAWRVFGYEKANGSPIALDISTAGIVTGSLTVNGTSSSPASLVLAEDTDNGTNTVTVISPASVASNRTATLQDDDGTLAYTKNIGVKANIQQDTLDTTFTNTSTSWTDITGLSVSITPTSASNRIKVSLSISAQQQNGTGQGFIRLVRDSTAIAVGATASSRTSCTFSVNRSENVPCQMNSITYIDSPATTSATTYKVQVQTQGGGTTYINRGADDSDAATSPRPFSCITVEEIAP